MNFVEILTILSISFFFLLGIFLVSNPKSRHIGFHWLGIFFILLGINFLDGLLILNSSIIQYPRLGFWEDPFVFLYGPLIYFFSIQFTSITWKWSFKTLMHFIPFILFELYIALFHITNSSKNISDIFQVLLEKPSDLKYLIVLVPVYMHITIYIFLARKKIFQQKKELKQQYSHIDLSWALSLINHISIIFLCAFISGLAQNLSPKSLFHLFILSINIIYIGLILHLLFKALNQPLFEKATRLSPVLDIPQEEVGTIKEKITTLLENQKIFYQPNLTLNEVASAIGYSERVVSYVIKKTLADNFYDLINGYRILDAKRIFKESSDQKLTVLEILYQVGFNSKSSFNTEFKKKTGMTPTEYRKTLK